MRQLPELLTLCVYAVLWTLLLPMLALYLALSPRHRPLLGRLRGVPASIPRNALWVHACSVGEVNAARPLLTALAGQFPGTPCYLTVSTRSGQEHAAATMPDVPRAWFPLDHPMLARRFVRQAAPQALILIETELWPGVLRAARQAGTTVILANGRLSDRHFARYRRIPWLVAPMMRALDAAAMQSSHYAERIRSLGMDARGVHVCGSVKFDGAVLELPKAERDRFATTIQPPGDCPLLVVGSSRPGDEARAVAAWEALKADIPGLQLALAPRHPARITEAERACAGHSTRRRSTCTPADPWRGGDILIVDTLGELLPFYALATAVLIGGSFDDAIQGHNPIEPAALGKPVVFGPHMRNFEEAAELLVEAEAARRVASEGELTAVLRELLADPDQCRAMGAAGKATVLAQQGAADRMALLIAQTLKKARG